MGGIAEYKVGGQIEPLGDNRFGWIRGSDLMVLDAGRNEIYSTADPAERAKSRWRRRLAAFFMLGKRGRDYVSVKHLENNKFIVREYDGNTSSWDLDAGIVQPIGGLVSGYSGSDKLQVMGNGTFAIVKYDEPAEIVDVSRREKWQKDAVARQRWGDAKLQRELGEEGGLALRPKPELPEDITEEELYKEEAFAETRDIVDNRKLRVDSASIDGGRINSATLGITPITEHIAHGKGTIGSSTWMETPEKIQNDSVMVKKDWEATKMPIKEALEKFGIKLPGIYDHTSKEKISEFLFKMQVSATSLVSVLKLKDGRIVTSGVDGGAVLWDIDEMTATLLPFYGSNIYSLVQLKDGRVAGGDAQGHISIFKLDKGTMFLEGHYDANKSLQASISGARGVMAIRSIFELKNGQLVTGSSDGTFKIWNLDPDEMKVQTVYGPMKAVLAIDEMEDGRIVTGSEDGKVRVWDIEKRKMTTTVERRSTISGLAVMKDGKIAVADDSTQLWIWDPDLEVEGATDRVFLTITGERGVSASFHSVKASRDGMGEKDGRIITATGSNTVKIWDLEKMGVTTIELGSDGFYLQGVNNDGSFIVSTITGEFSIWDPYRREKLHIAKRDRQKWEEEKLKREMTEDDLPPIPELPARITEGDLAPDRRPDFAKPKPIVEGELDPKKEEEGFGSITAHEVTPIAGNIEKIPAPKIPRAFPKLADNNGYMYTRKLEGDFAPVYGEKIDVKTKEELEKVRVQQGSDYLADGNIYFYKESIKEKLAEEAIGTNEIMDFRDGKNLRELLLIFSSHNEKIRAFEELPDGRIVTTQDDGVVKVWDFEKMEVLVLDVHMRKINSVLVLQDGSIVTASADKTLKVWNLDPDKVEVKTFKDRRGASSICEMKDGRIATVSLDNIVYIWDLRPDKMERTVLVASDMRFRKVAALKDGRILTAANDGIVRIWDPVNMEITTLEGPKEIVYSVTELDGNRIAAGIGDEVYIWDFTTKKESGKITLSVLWGHSHLVYGLAQLSDGSIASAARNKIVKVWNLDKMEVKTLEAEGAMILSFKKLKDDRVLTGDGSGIANIFDPLRGDNWRKAKKDRQIWSEEKTRIEMEFGKRKAKKKKAKPRIPLPEDEAILETRMALATGGRAMLIMQPGAREKVVIDESAERAGIKSVKSLEGSNGLTVENLFGGLSPRLVGEGGKKEILYKKGFFTRYMVRSKEEAEMAAGETVLLVIHNIDAVPEKVRAAFNNLMLNGFVEIPNEGKYYIPDNVKIIATMHSSSQKDFSSAFPNRFTKVNVGAIDIATDLVSDFLKYIMRVYKLDMDTAGTIEMVLALIVNLESGREIWPSGRVYGFTVKEALTHAKFTALGIEEMRRSGVDVTEEDIKKIVLREAMRVYGARLQEQADDIRIFTRIMLPTLFAEDIDAINAVSTEFGLQEGRVSSISGIPVQPSEDGMHPGEIDKKYRLTMVKTMVRTISNIIRGFQAGKVVALTGETGVAKTTMGINIAKLLGLKDYVFSMHKDVKAYEVTGGITMTDAGNYKHQISGFAETLKEGNAVLIVDEANIKPEILWVLAGIARGEKKFTIEMPGDSSVEIELGENVFVMLTMNPESYEGGRVELPLSDQGRYVQDMGSFRISCR